MACEIKLKGVKLTQPQLTQILAQLAQDPHFKNALVFDNYMRLTSQEKEIDTDVFNFIQTEFNFQNIGEVIQSIESERTRREGLGKLDLKGQKRGVLTLEKGKDNLNEIKKFTKGLFTNKGKWRFFGKKSGGMMHDEEMRKQGLINEQISLVNNAAKKYELAKSKVKNYLTTEDLIAFNNVLNGADYKSVPFVKLISDPAKRASVEAIMKPAIEGFRDQIINSQKELANQLGGNVVMIDIISNSLGEYTTRLYEVHRNPNFFENFEKNRKGEFKGGDFYEQVFNNASSIVEDMLRDELPELRSDLAAAQNNLAKLQSNLAALQSNNVLGAQNQSAINTVETLIDKESSNIDFLKAEIANVNYSLSSKEALHNYVVNYLKNEGRKVREKLVPDLGAGGQRSAFARSIFKKRKNIGSEIRDLLGEINDPVLAFSATIAKLVSASSNIGFQKLLGNLNNQFLADYIKASTTGRQDQVPAPFFSPKPFPEAGLTTEVTFGADQEYLAKTLGYTTAYTNKDFYEEVYGLQKVNTSWLVSRLMAINTFAKMAATVYSIATGIRNIYGNIIPISAKIITSRNRMKMLSALSLSVTERARQELSRVKNAKAGFIASPYSKEYQDHASVMQRQNLTMSELSIADIATDLANKNNFLNKLLVTADNYSWAKPTKDVVVGVSQLFQRLYAGGDNIFKEMVFIDEAENYAWALYDKTYAELKKTGTPDQIQAVENKAGKLARDILPNYNEAYGIVKEMQKSGLSLLFGPFIMFRAEQFRTLFATTGHVHSEMTDSNPRIKQLGRRRMLYLMNVVAMSATATAKIIATMMFDDEEEPTKAQEEFIRKYWVPEHVAAPIITVNSQNGYFNITDMASVNIAGNISEFETIFQDISAGVSADEALFSYLNKLTGSIFSEQLGTGLISDLFSFKDQYDNPIWNETDEWNVKMMKWGKAFSNFLPGTVKSLARVDDKVDQLERASQLLSTFESQLPLNPSKTDLGRLDVLKREVARRELEIEYERKAIIPAIRTYLRDPSTQVPPKIYEVINRRKSISGDYTKNVNEKDPKKITRRDRVEIYQDLRKKYWDGLDDVKEYYNKAVESGYGEVTKSIFQLNRVSAATKHIENNKPMFSAKELDYIFGESDTKPDLVILDHDSNMDIVRDKNGNVKE